MRIVLLSVSAAVCLASCATAPAHIPIQNSRVVALSKDDVWSNLVEHFATSNIAIKTIEKDSGIIYAERMFATGNDLSSYADCGVPGMATPIGGAADLNVFVRETGSGVNVTVNARYRQMRQSAWGPGVTTIDCSSLGTMERDLLEAAAKG